MASKTQETLLEHFHSIASDSKPGSSSLIQATSDNRVGISGSDAAIPLIGSPPPPTTSSETSSGTGSSGLGLAAEVFGSGLGVVPLVTGLMDLFGGKSSGPLLLSKYVMPQSLAFTGADTGGGIAEANFDQLGTPRLAGAAADYSNGASPTSPSGIGSGGAFAPQISVTVQAMDAQSFLDHSSDIAQAVRHAMLTSNSINDVINDL